MPETPPIVGLEQFIALFPGIVIILLYAGILIIIGLLGLLIRIVTHRYNLQMERFNKHDELLGSREREFREVMAKTMARIGALEYRVFGVPPAE